MEKIETIASVVSQTVKTIRKALEGNDLEGAKKEIVFQRAMASLPKELRGLNLVMTGDNWLWENPKTNAEEALYPDIAASVALTERDDRGNIICCAMAPVLWWSQWAVAAEEKGVYILNQEGFFKVRAVNPILLEHPPRIYIFGQKSTPHWVAMNSIIGQLNQQGLRVANDCGPFYGLMAWFSNLDGQVITPRNVVYIEPYNNKPKEELMAFVIYCLNKGLSQDDQFVLRTMSGRPIFEGGEFQKIPNGLREPYRGVGFIIAPTEAAHGEVMVALSRVVLGSSIFTSPEANEKMRKLRQDLEP